MMLLLTPVVVLSLGAKIEMISQVILSTCQWHHSSLLPQMIVQRTNVIRDCVFIRIVQSNWTCCTCLDSIFNFGYVRLFCSAVLSVVRLFYFLFRSIRLPSHEMSRGKTHMQRKLISTQSVLLKIKRCSG